MLKQEVESLIKQALEVKDNPFMSELDTIKLFFSRLEDLIQQYRDEYTTHDATVSSAYLQVETFFDLLQMVLDNFNHNSINLSIRYLNSFKQNFDFDNAGQSVIDILNNINFAAMHSEHEQAVESSESDASISDDEDEEDVVQPSNTLNKDNLQNMKAMLINILATISENPDNYRNYFIKNKKLTNSIFGIKPTTKLRQAYEAALKGDGIDLDFQNSTAIRISFGLKARNPALFTNFIKDLARLNELAIKAQAQAVNSSEHSESEEEILGQFSDDELFNTARSEVKVKSRVLASSSSSSSSSETEEEQEKLLEQTEIASQVREEQLGTSSESELALDDEEDGDELVIAESTSSKSPELNSPNALTFSFRRNNLTQEDTVTEQVELADNPEATQMWETLVNRFK